MKFADRVIAAVGAFTGKTPQPKSEAHPNFFTYSVGDTPTNNVTVNVQQLRAFSENNPVVRRAIDYIRNQVARLDHHLVVKQGKKLTKEQKRKMEIARNSLLNPNPDDSFQQWLGILIDDMLVVGMGVSEIKTWNGNVDRPFLFFPVDAGTVELFVNWDGSPSKPRYAQVDLYGRQIDFKNDELFVVRHNPRSSTPFGLSPVEVAIQQIQYFLQAQAYAGQTASNATPKKLLWLGEEITEQQLREFRMYFKEEIEGRSHMGITGGHSEPKSIELGLAKDESLFLTWQSFLIAQVANAFNLDIMKFNNVIGINRSTSDVLDDISDEGAVRPMAAAIEQAINTQILPLFGISDFCEFKFQFTASFSDRKSLAVIHQIMLQMDQVTINEARREAGYDDLPFDEKLGKSKGDYTLSEYRAIYGGFVSLQDAIGVDEDTNTPGTQKLMEEKNQSDADLKKQQLQQKNTGTTDPNKGGNNGVHGVPAPKDKPMNKGKDK